MGRKLNISELEQATINYFQEDREHVVAVINTEEGWGEFEREYIIEKVKDMQRLTIVTASDSDAQKLEKGYLNLQYFFIWLDRIRCLNPDIKVGLR